MKTTLSPTSGAATACGRADVAAELDASFDGEAPLARAPSDVAKLTVGLLIVGLIASLVQSVTSIQEPTLTFIPKLLALSGLAILLTPWLLRSLSEFTIMLITRMGTLGH